MSDAGLNEEQLDGENYSFKVGERLRLVRRQKRMSLQEVEAESGRIQSFGPWRIRTRGTRHIGSTALATRTLL